MQRSYLRVLLGGVLIAATSQLHAEALQPDPAWQQESWQTDLTGNYCKPRSVRMTGFSCVFLYRPAR